MRFVENVRDARAGKVIVWLAGDTVRPAVTSVEPANAAVPLNTTRIVYVPAGSPAGRG